MSAAVTGPLVTPTSVCSNRTRLRPSRLAPTSRTTEMATSATISARRTRRPCEPPVALGVPCFSAVMTSVDCNAGRSPTASAVAIDATAAKTSTGMSTRMASSRGTPAGFKAMNAITLDVAIPTPSAPPPAPISAPCTSACQTSRAREAPSARRTAVSRDRDALRASIRFATLAHATSSTRPTAANSTTSVGFAAVPAVMRSRSTTALAWRFESSA